MLHCCLPSGICTQTLSRSQLMQKQDELAQSTAIMPLQDATWKEHGSIRCSRALTPRHEQMVDGGSQRGKQDSCQSRESWRENQDQYEEEKTLWKNSERRNCGHVDVGGHYSQFCSLHQAATEQKRSLPVPCHGAIFPHFLLLGM